MKKCIILLIYVLSLVTPLTRAWSTSLINFSLTLNNLTVTDPALPMLFEFTTENTSAFSVSLISASAVLGGPANGTFALSPFTSGLSFFTPHVLNPMGNPGDSFTGDFGTFTFFSGMPAGTTQDITFNLTAFAITPPTGFTFDVNFASGSASVVPGSAAVVPEPATLTLLALGLLGTAGLRKLKKKYNA